MAFTGADLEARFLFDDPVEFVVTPRYNIAPTQDAPVVVMREGHRRLEKFRWGLVPPWADDPGMGARMINARAETVHQSKAFRSAFTRRRCLVPASGFFEWKKEQGGARKTPYNFFMKDEQAFAFAGLWEIWQRDPNSPPLHSFTIITTDANGLVKPVHDRMPVILSRDAETVWLDPGQGDEHALRALLRPCPVGDMACHTVSALVNSPKNDSPECIRPASTPQQENLFPE
jgi:putative SOS response-associated peptidase YedK